MNHQKSAPSIGMNYNLPPNIGRENLKIGANSHSIVDNHCVLRCVCFFLCAERIESNQKCSEILS